MRTVYKYLLEVATEPTEHAMPEGAKILHVHAEGEDIHLWAEVEDRNETELRRFMAIGTGGRIPDRAVYCGTAHVPPLVYHVYEV